MITETTHELSAEHAGFRAEHEKFTAGIVALGVVGAAVTGGMIYFAFKNDEAHLRMQKQINGILGLVEDHERTLTPSGDAQYIIDDLRKLGEGQTY